MANETVARRYATAIFGLARDQGAVEGVGRALRRLYETLDGDPQIRRFFVSPVISRSDKTKLLSEAFAANCNEIALHALLLLVRKRREALLGPIVAQYEQLQLSERGAEPLSITSAQPLDESTAESVVRRLSQIYGKKFAVTRKVDPELIGGLRVMMGDRRVDGTIAGRLDDLARKLYQTA